MREGDKKDNPSEDMNRVFDMIDFPKELIRYLKFMKV
jgi:hypothetical protein